MAIRSRFARNERFLEIPGCPLRGASDDETACASCRFNVLDPGQARVGCVLETKFADYQSALAHLERIDPAAHRRVREILERQTHVPESAGLTPDEAAELSSVAERWARLAPSRPEERDIVSAMYRFCTGSLELGEPVRILS